MIHVRGNVMLRRFAIVVVLIAPACGGEPSTSASNEAGGSSAAGSAGAGSDSDAAAGGGAEGGTVAEAGASGSGGSSGAAGEGAPGPDGQDASLYVATFAEEFDTGFDTSVWNDHIWYESSDPTKNYAVEGGSLKIWPERNAAGNFVNRTIDTDGKYTQTYGFFEMRAKLPIGKGVWPAFWIFNHIGDRRPEIDIMEAYPGGGPSSGWGDADLHPIAYGATIWLDAGQQGGAKMIATPDLSADFHTYGLKWEPSKQSFFFDGNEVYSAAVSMNDPMYIILDLWFGSASGQPDASTPTGPSNAFEVSYVRAWQLK
jgi:beta-glucanase (GH16 family)